MKPEIDLAGIPDESVREMHQLAEACLAGTMQLGIAADQRATTMLGIFGAGSVALLAAIATILAATPKNWPFIAGAATAAVLLFIAAALSAWAARPIYFYTGGYEPRRLAPSAGNAVWMLRYAIADLQVRIDANRVALERSSRLTNWAMLLALAAIVLGTIVGAIVFSCGVGLE